MFGCTMVGTMCRAIWPKEDKLKSQQVKASTIMVVRTTNDQGSNIYEYYYVREVWNTVDFVTRAIKIVAGGVTAFVSVYIDYSTKGYGVRSM